MSYDAYIFDLDGTLLDTLPDLTALTNMVLAERGMPTHTDDEVNSYVGNGARALMERAVPEGTPSEDVDAILARWKSLYPEHGHKFTKPYPGIPEVLANLKERGAKLAVLSNKFDAATQQVIGSHFPGVFDMVQGECADVPRKPDPTGLLLMMQQLGVRPERTAYVGDSGSDMTVAHAANATAIGVTWGYRGAEVLRAAGADVLIDSPVDLMSC